MTTAEPTLADRDGAIWMNGELIDWRDAKVHVLTHTLTLGGFLNQKTRANEIATARFDNVTDPDGIRGVRLQVFFRSLDDTWRGLARIADELISLAMRQ